MRVGENCHPLSNCDAVAASPARLAVVAILVMFAALFAAGSYGALPDTIDQVRPAVVGVGTARPVRQPGAKGPPVRFLGTGFAVGDGTLVVSNHHVIPTQVDREHGESLAVFSGRGEEGEARVARVVATDPEHDLVLLAISGDPLPALALGEDREVREGQSVAFTGYPIGTVLGLYPVTHRGIVSAITPTVIPALSSSGLSAARMQRLRSPFNIYQLDATAYPGNSGSPVYDVDTGEVLGVLNSVFIKESKETLLERPSGISYAIPVRYVRHLLSQNGKAGKPASNRN